MRMRSCIITWLLFCAVAICAQETNSSLVQLSELPFFLGREYFVLRSGRAQMIVQADRADLGPAFTYLLFDAENAGQSRTKAGAFNFVPNEGFDSSALVVDLGGFPFTALGQRNETHWILERGIPPVWWAGGIRVTERISALSSNGLFCRTIRLEGANLVGRENVRLRLVLPRGEYGRERSILMQR